MATDVNDVIYDAGCAPEDQYGLTRVGCYGFVITTSISQQN